MRTQTKCTLFLSGMFIVEILPLPFTAMMSLYLYTVRKRSAWLPEVVENLYADKADALAPQPVPKGHDYLVTRRKCTMTLTMMFLVDIIIPVTIPFSLYVVRRRPAWFRDLVARLYADQLTNAEDSQAAEEQDASAQVDEEAMQRKYQQLQQGNMDFARTIGARVE